MTGPADPGTRPRRLTAGRQVLNLEAAVRHRSGLRKKVSREEEAMTSKDLALEYAHLAYVDATHTLCGVPRTASVVVTTDLEQVGCPRCLTVYDRLMDEEYVRESEVKEPPREPDCNCNFCGNDYLEEESDASSPGMYCSEQCEIDEEEENERDE